jgi:CheY-like chemotaxis protein
MSKILKVLHVEDDPDILEIANLALADVGGMTVLQCSDGPTALASVDGFGPDIMLLDVMMPGMSGTELLGHLQSNPRLRGVPAVFMTARAQTSEIAELKALGAVDVILKPFDPMTLADDLMRVFDRTLAA